MLKKIFIMNSKKLIDNASQKDLETRFLAGRIFFWLSAKKDIDKLRRKT